MKTHKSIHGGTAVDRGRRRNTHAFGCGNTGDRYLVDLYVDFCLRHRKIQQREHFALKGVYQCVDEHGRAQRQCRTCAVRLCSFDGRTKHLESA